MNNKQLVTEITQYIEAILLAEAENFFTPQYNQQKTFACFIAKFRIHGDFSNKLKPSIFSQLLTRCNHRNFPGKALLPTIQKET